MTTSFEVTTASSSSGSKHSLSLTAAHAVREFETVVEAESFGNQVRFSGTVDKVDLGKFTVVACMWRIAGCMCLYIAEYGVAPLEEAWQQLANSRITGFNETRFLALALIKLASMAGCIFGFQSGPYC